jgi:hypothetical protein
MAEKANIEEAPAPFYKETKLSKAQQKKVYSLKIQIRKYALISSGEQAQETGRVPCSSQRPR